MQPCPLSHWHAMALNPGKNDECAPDGARLFRLAANPSKETGQLESSFVHEKKSVACFGSRLMVRQRESAALYQEQMSTRGQSQGRQVQGRLQAKAAASNS